MTVGVCGFDEGSGEQTKDANQIDRRESATRLLAFALRPGGLIFGGVGHGDAGSVHELDVTTVPKRVVGNAGLDAVHKVGLDAIEHVQGNLGASLAVGGRSGTRPSFFLGRNFSTGKGLDLAHGFTAGSAGRLHLIEKTPENHIERKESFAAVGT